MTTFHRIRVYLPAVLVLAAGLSSSPVRLGLSLFWFLLGTALVAAALQHRRWHLAGAEALLGLAALHALPGMAFSLPPSPLGVPGGPGPTPADGRQTNTVSWRAAFTAANQAAMKVIPVPAEMRGQPLLVRVDLGSDYQGSAGFTLEVNDAPIGTLSRAATGTSYLGGRAGPYWGRRVPAGLLSGPEARIVLRPLRLDTTLTIAGHGDRLIDPFGHSAFFDGTTWRPDHLAGPTTPAAGTYRIWLVP